MARSDKVAAVAELAEAFRGSSAVVLTEYRGLSVKQLTDLRRALGVSASYAIVKNTLTKIAAKEAGVEGIEGHLVGPSAIAFVKGDPVDAAKGLRDFARANPVLVIKGGVLEGKLITADEIKKLADLESREVLLAKMAGAMKASLVNAVSLFNAPLTQTARLIEALRQQAEASVDMAEAGISAEASVDMAEAGTSAEASDNKAEAPTDEASDSKAEADQNEG